MTVELLAIMQVQANRSESELKAEWFETSENTDHLIGKKRSIHAYKDVIYNLQNMEFDDYQEAAGMK